MSTPNVSVLMTAYNREKYIAEAIESVLASTFEDFELIIVDDVSKDRTVEIARQYETDSRVQVHLNEKNLGDYPNRNRAAELAKGKYLKYVDSDDVIYPHGLEVMIRCMRQFPDAGLGLCRLEADTIPYPFQRSSLEAYRQHFFGEHSLTNAPLSTIIGTEVFHKLGGFSGRRYVGDSEMWLQIAARYPIVEMMAGLTWWRSHGEQEFNLGHTSFSYSKLNFVIAMEALNSPDCPLSAAEKKVATDKVARSHARALLKIAARGQTKQAARMWRAAGFAPKYVLRAVLPAPKQSTAY